MQRLSSARLSPSHPRSPNDRRNGSWFATASTVLAFVLGGCSGNASPDEEDPTPEPTTASSTAPAAPSDTSTVATTGTTELVDDLEGDDGQSARITGIAKDSQVPWVMCDATEQTTDHVGNYFASTFCMPATDEPVSFFEYTTNETLGMLDEYTETTYVAPEWAVAATSTEQLTTIVTNLKRQGYEGFAQLDTTGEIFVDLEDDVLSDGGHRAFLAISWSQSDESDQIDFCQLWDIDPNLLIPDLTEQSEVAVGEELLRAFYDDVCEKLAD